MHPSRRELQAILSAPFSTVTHHPHKELVTNVPGVQVFYPSSEAFPLPQCRLPVVSQGLNQEAETQSCSHGSSCQGSSAWGTHMPKDDCKTSAALVSAPLLLSTDGRFYQEMAARKKCFPETRGAWNRSPFSSKHSFA